MVRLYWTASAMQLRTYIGIGTVNGGTSLLGAELNAELTKLGSERVGPMDMANTDQVATYFQISVITSASPSPES